MSSKAADLLLALNNQIKHEGADEPAEKPKAKIGKTSNKKGPNLPNINLYKSSKKLHQPSQTIDSQPSNRKMRDQQSHEAPECLVQILAKQIGDQIPEGLSEVVESILKQRQKNTYDSLTSNNNNYYIEAMMNNARKKNESNMELIMSAMNNRVGKVETEVECGKLLIIPEANLNSKKQLEFISKLDLARMIKIKQGQLRSKMDILNEKITNIQEAESWNGVNADEERIQEQLQKRMVESMDYNSYALDSQKTKIARNYVKHMNRQRKLFDKRRKQRQHRYGQHEVEKEGDMQEALQMKDLAKRQEIIERIEQKRRKREEQQQYLQTKEKEVQSFLSEYHTKKPLFKLKQKQFIERIVKPQERLRQQRLNEIREYKKSMSLNQIRSHQVTYINNLKTDRQKRKQEFKLIMSSRKVEDQTKAYYKGQAHKRVNQMTNESQKRKQALMEGSKLRAMRRREYSEVIHDKHKPQIDQKKKEQLMNVIEAEMMRKNRAKKVFKQIVDEKTNQIKTIWHYQPLPQRDYKSEGKKLFEQAKKNIKKKQPQTQSQHEHEEEKQEEIKSSRRSPRSMHLLSGQHPPQLQSSIKNIWSARSKQLKQFAHLQVADAKNFEFVKHNIQNLDNKAAQRQDLMNKLNMSMGEHIDGKNMLDKFYLESIKQKIRLLQ